MRFLTCSILWLSGLLTCEVFGAVVPIDFGQLNQAQTVDVTSFSNKVCVQNIGCGGSFDANISPVANQPWSPTTLNATIWCVDSQLSANSAPYTAYVRSLAWDNGVLNAMTVDKFDDSRYVRYGDVGEPGGGTWDYSLVGSGYTAFQNGVDPLNALTRYRLAAILITQYTPTLDNPSDTSYNDEIQVAIWKLTATNASNVSLAESNTGVSNTNVKTWINYAIGVLNSNTFNFNYWAVISGGYDVTTGRLLNNSGSMYQTFLVKTPEPRFYGLLLVGLLTGFGLMTRRKKES